MEDAPGRGNVWGRWAGGVSGFSVFVIDGEAFGFKGGQGKLDWLPWVTIGAMVTMSYRRLQWVT